MKKVNILQCVGLALGLLGFLNYAEYREISRRLDSIEYKMELRTDESKKSTEYQEYPHTRVEEFLEDTDEQIQEEIRLGEMELLAQLIHAEASTEDLDGKRLVADVVLNRVDAGWADGTIEGVIYQNITVNGITYWQFDTAGNGMIDKAGWEMTESDYVAAQLEYEAEIRMDTNIMYFRTEHYHPYGTPAYKYGRHYFNYE